jgi:polysaccharide export outer membrane protein
MAGKSESGLYFDGFTVDDHGNIRMPVLGEINVIGYTLDEIRIRIEKQLLSEYFKKEANIFVTVKLAGFRYTINGEIGSMGTKTLFQEHVNIMEAIANSGDITITGNRKSVSIIRQSPTGTEIHDIDLTDINVMKSPYFYLQPNDYIYVKPLKQKTWGTGKTGIESLGTIITLLSLATTTFLLLKN